MAFGAQNFFGDIAFVGQNGGFQGDALGFDGGNSLGQGIDALAQPVAVERKKSFCRFPDFCKACFDAGKAPGKVGGDKGTLLSSHLVKLHQSRQQAFADQGPTVIDIFFNLHGFEHAAAIEQMLKADGRWQL